MLTEKQNFIRDFDKHNEYSSFSGGTDYIRPNVSSCEKENHVHYSPCEDVSGVTISPSSILLEIGGTSALTLNILPEGVCNKNVTWSSRDENIAIVDENGVVSGISDTIAATGRTIITVVTEEGGYSGQCDVKTIHPTNTVTYYAPSALGCSTNFSYSNVNIINPYSFRAKNSADDTSSGTDARCSNHSFSNGIGKMSPNFTIDYLSGAAFYNCKKVTKIIVPAGVTRIGHGCFEDCIGLECIVFESINPPRWVRVDQGSPFAGTTCPIYVPAESLEKYKTANYWKGIASRIYPMPE